MERDIVVITDEARQDVNPFDSFIPVYNMLIWSGYFKLLSETSKFKKQCHLVYRVVVSIWCVIYNSQHVLYVTMVVQDIVTGIEAMFIAIPLLNLLLKACCINFNVKRVDKINEVMNDPIFGAYSDLDAKIINENKENMWKLCKVVNINSGFVGLLWSLWPIAKRLQDENTVVPAVMPFETNTWPKFLLSVLMEHGVVFWAVFSHLSMDNLIGTYYSQAATQLKVIKHNLTNILNVKDNTEKVDRGQFKFVDELDPQLHKRFVHYVKRYEKVAWYSQEVEDIFNAGMMFQFLSTYAIVGTVIYRMSGMEMASVQFSFLFTYSLIVQMQILLYCYFGGLVEHESKSVMDAIYLSDWTSVSPRFRGLIIIAMSRWYRPITPKAAGLVPLSLNTFIIILQRAYSLYAMLKTT